MATDPKADIGFGPTMPPITTLPPGARSGYISGPSVDAYQQGRIVAYAIRCQADFKVGDRDFSGEVSLHEVVTMRAFYEELGGNINLAPRWPIALQRLVPLDQNQVKAELARMSEMYKIPNTTGEKAFVPIYLGADSATQMRNLHEIMRKQLEAWTELVKVALGRLSPRDRSTDEHVNLSRAYENITAKELEDIARIGDPSFDGQGDIELPEVLAPPMPTVGVAVGDAEAPSATMQDDGAEQLAMIEKLKGAGLDESQALQITSMLELTDGELSDDDIVKTVGNRTKLAAVKRVLKG